MHTANRQFYSVEETAAILGLSKITIHRQTKTGKMPSVKIGSRVLIPTSYIQSLTETAFINEGGRHD